MQMLLGIHFRLTQPVKAIAHQGETSNSEVIPESAVVIVDAVHDGDRLVQVRYNGRELLILSQDFRESSRPLLPVSADTSQIGDVPGKERRGD